MADTVFVLGAGASKQGGAPLMSDFLHTAYQLWKEGRLSQVDEACKQVFGALSVFSNVHSKARLDLDNLESVFTAFEMARTIGGFAKYNATDAEQLTSALKTLIVATLEATFQYHLFTHSVRAPEPYTAFANLVVRLQREAAPRCTVAIITFNYDLGADFALRHADLSVDYGLSARASPGVPLLKLHGSLNWVKCPGCDCIVDWPLQKFVDLLVPRLTMRGGVLEEDRRERLGSILLSPYLERYTHCGANPVEPVPVLVPPTWAKAEYHRALSPVWSRAAQELREAENIFVVGYSLPPTDAFFNYLYALGATGEAILRRFWVYNPDETVAERFKRLLGPGAEAKSAFKAVRFEQAIADIERAFFPEQSRHRRASSREY